MTEYQQYQQPPMPTDTSNRRRKWLIAAAVVGAFFVGSMVGQSTERDKTVAVSANSPVAVTETVTAPPAAAAQPAAKTQIVKVTETVPPKGLFGDGSWLVGRDVKAGRYTTVEEVSGTCYWARHKVGTDTIIANDLVSGGHPTVLLKTGEEFRTRDCGEWKAA